MALTRNLKPTFTETVLIAQPDGEPEKLVVEFYTKRKSEYQALFVAPEGGGRLKDEAVLAKLIKSWDSTEFECTEAGIAELLDVHWSAAADLFTAYQRGRIEGRRKN